jgi:hypothetical protein
VNVGRLTQTEGLSMIERFRDCVVLRRKGGPDFVTAAAGLPLGATDLGGALLPAFNRPSWAPDSERAIRWLIALMVLCCDPLAIALTAAAPAGGRKRKNALWADDARRRSPRLEGPAPLFPHVDPGLTTSIVRCNRHIDI